MKLILCAILASLLSVFKVVQSKNDNEDQYGVFYFDASSMDFSSGAIYPRACISQSDGDFVVFDIYQNNHNTCKRHSLGTYKQDIMTFIVAYAKQQAQDNELYGNNGGYEIDEDVLMFLQCQQYYYNNNMFYLKLGCRDTTNKGFQINSYSDAYCTQKATTSYNLGVDISSLRVSFDTCKDCTHKSMYSQYNQANGVNYNNAQNNYGYNYQQQGNYFAYQTPLCSAAYNYKQTCNGSCKRATRRAGSSKSSFGGGGSSWSGDGFSPMGKFFLWIMSFSAIFFLLASLAQRKRMSKTDTVLEEAAIKSAGVDKKYIPRIFIGIAVFIILLILFKRKILTWFFLTAINVALLAYWIHLKNKADEKASIGDYQMYGGGVAA